MRVGIVFGTFAPMHLGHMDVVRLAESECDRVIVVCCGYTGDRGYPLLPLELRYRYVTEAVKDITPYVLYFPDTAPDIKAHWNAEQIWKYWLLRMQIEISESRMADVMRDEIIWYAGEKEYCDLISKSGQNVRCANRKRDISATLIRENPKAYADLIVPPFTDVFIGEI